MTAIPVTENYFNQEVIMLAGRELKLTGSSYPERELYRQTFKEVGYDEQVNALRAKLSSDTQVEIDILEAETAYLKTTLEELKKNLSSSEAKDEYRKQSKELHDKTLELGNLRRERQALNDEIMVEMDKLDYLLHTTFIYNRLGLKGSQTYGDWLKVIEAEEGYDLKIMDYMRAKGFLVDFQPQTTSS
jgi:hypothetical protein